jgi:hypothetical protein
MPKSTPEEREQDFVAPENAQEHGFYGSAVSEYPNEMYTVEGIANRKPGGPVGVTEEEFRSSIAQAVPTIEPGEGGEGRTDTSENLRKEQDEAAEARENMGPGTVRAEDDPAQSPRREKLGK